MFFKSLVEQDDTSIVICDLDHTIIYMNKTAIDNYNKRGGASLIGRNLLACHNPHSGVMINKVVDWFKESKENNFMHTSFVEKDSKDIYMIALRDDDGNLIGYYEKHEYRTVDKTPFYEGINI